MPIRLKLTPTDAILLWCRENGYPEPVTEYRFAAPVRDWRFDLAFIDQKIAVEIDGAVFAGGRHTRGKGFTEDRVKDAEALCRGWCVLHITPGQVKSGQAMGWLMRLLRKREGKACR